MVRLGWWRQFFAKEVGFECLDTYREAETGRFENAMKKEEDKLSIDR